MADGAVTLVSHDGPKIGSENRSPTEGKAYLTTLQSPRQQDCRTSLKIVRLFYSGTIQARRSCVDGCTSAPRQPNPPPARESRCLRTRKPRHSDLDCAPPAMANAASLPGKPFRTWPARIWITCATRWRSTSPARATLRPCAPQRVCSMRPNSTGRCGGMQISSPPSPAFHEHVMSMS